MNVHCIQHVEFETPAYIKTIIAKHRHQLQVTHLYRNESLPDPSSIDMLLIMGGPMGVNDDLACPWFAEEKKYIQKCIDMQKKILGICLGAQIIAHVLGAQVRKNSVKEIGFFPVQFKKNDVLTKLLDNVPDTVTAFHWHGDTFDIPSGAIGFATSNACTNQGFSKGTSIVGLQFHLETTVESMHEMIRHCKGELVEGQWIQDEETIQSLYRATEEQNHNLMEQLYLNLSRI